MILPLAIIIGGIYGIIGANIVAPARSYQTDLSRAWYKDFYAYIGGGWALPRMLVWTIILWRETRGGRNFRAEERLRRANARNRGFYF